RKPREHRFVIDDDHGGLAVSRTARVAWTVACSCRRQPDLREPVVADMPDFERRGAFGTPALGGTSVALLFWWQSLTPTLIPRSWEMQVVVSAACLIIGYAIGTFAGRWAYRLLEWLGRSPGIAIRRHSWIVLGAAWLIGVLVGAALWKRW